MKAVVLEIRGDKAAVMTSDGQVRRIDNLHFDIGQQIIVKDKEEKAPIISRSAQKVMKFAAAAAALLLVVARGTYIYSSPYGVVSLDVNPSIEFTINRLDKVLCVNGVNDDGKNIIDSINGNKLINMSIEKAVDVTIDQIESEGYFAGEDRNYVVVAANTIQETHTDKLVNKLDGSLTNNQKVKPIAMKASDEDLTAAREKGTSPGKMMIVESLDSVSAESIDKDEWLGKSVADIVHEYNKCTNNAEESMKVAESSSDEGSENRSACKPSSSKKSAKKQVSEAAKEPKAETVAAAASTSNQGTTAAKDETLAAAADALTSEAAATKDAAEVQLPEVQPAEEASQAPEEEEKKETASTADKPKDLPTASAPVVTGEEDPSKEDPSKDDPASEDPSDEDPSDDESPDEDPSSDEVTDEEIQGDEGDDTPTDAAPADETPCEEAENSEGSEEVPSESVVEEITQEPAQALVS